jgi:hypothetical protein
MKIHLSIDTPIREFVDMDHRWRSSDKGLIWCWEHGRLVGQEDHDLATRAKSGELMVLSWKGGVPPGFKSEKKQGTLNYLAQWQGIAGKDLNIDTDATVELECSATGVKVVFSKAGWRQESRD